MRRLRVFFVALAAISALSGCGSWAPLRQKPADAEQVAIIWKRNDFGPGQYGAPGEGEFRALGAAGLNPVAAAAVILATTIASDITSTTSVPTKLPVKYRMMNVATCEILLGSSDLKIEPRTAAIPPGGIAKWLRSSSGELTLVPILKDDGAQLMLKRSHPCFSRWVEEYKGARFCLECIHVHYAGGTDKDGKPIPEPTFPWADD
jgi:hypothetical protein